MKKNLIAFLIVLILGGITLWLVKRNGNTTVPKDLRDFALNDTAAVTRIFMADRANHQVTLNKIRAGEWTVNNKWRARNDGIFNLLFVIKNLAIKSMVGISAQENVTKELASSAIKIEIYQGEKLVRCYYVGGATQDNEGTFMLLSDPETKKNSSRPFVMCIEGQSRYLTPVYNTNEAEWRDRTILSYYPPDIRSVKVEFMQATGTSYEVLQPAYNTFTVKNLKTNTVLDRPDTLAIKQYLSYFQSQSYESLIPGIDPQRKDSVLKSQPMYVLTVQDKNNKPTEIRFFAMEPRNVELDAHGKPEKYDLDKMYALINKQEFAVVQYFVFGKILTDIEYFTLKHNTVKK
jgi:hypothetical protein